jgi:hypothetical protein
MINVQFSTTTRTARSAGNKRREQTPFEKWLPMMQSLAFYLNVHLLTLRRKSGIWCCFDRDPVLENPGLAYEKRSETIGRLLTWQPASAYSFGRQKITFSLLVPTRPPT